MSNHDQDDVTRPQDLTDLLFGAEAMAAALGLTRRQVYHAVESGHIPAFRIGATICARRSTLMRWFDKKEAAAFATPEP